MVSGVKDQTGCHNLMVKTIVMKMTESIILKEELKDVALFDQVTVYSQNCVTGDRETCHSCRF